MCRMRGVWSRLFSTGGVLLVRGLEGGAGVRIVSYARVWSRLFSTGGVWLVRGVGERCR